MNQPVQNTTIVMGVQSVGQKSMGTAILLAMFFGPLGLLYATVRGGIIMAIVTPIVIIFTLGLGFFIMLPICVIWAAVAVNKHREQQAVSLNHSATAPADPARIDHASGEATAQHSGKPDIQQTP